MEEQLLQAIDIASHGPRPGQDPSIIQDALRFLEQVKQNTQEVWSSAWSIFAARSPEVQSSGSGSGGSSSSTAPATRPLHGPEPRFFCLNLVCDFLEDRCALVER